MNNHKKTLLFLFIFIINCVKFNLFVIIVCVVINHNYSKKKKKKEMKEVISYISLCKLNCIVLYLITRIYIFFNLFIIFFKLNKNPRLYL